MSLRLLSDAEECGKHTFADDMEALLYVIFYCALFYLPHNLEVQDLTSVNSVFFESTQMLGDLMSGGDGKLANKKYREFPDDPLRQCRAGGVVAHYHGLPCAPRGPRGGAQG